MMDEYSRTDVSRKRKKRKSSPPPERESENKPIKRKGTRIIPLDRVNVYSGEGKVELWWTDFGRLVIRTFGHDERHHADIDAVDLVKDLQTLCRNHSLRSS